MYQGYPLTTNQDHSPPHLAFLAAALRFLLVRVALPRLAPSCSTAIRRSSVSVTDRSPKRGLPRLGDLSVTAGQYGNRLRLMLMGHGEHSVLQDWYKPGTNMG